MAKQIQIGGHIYKSKREALSRNQLILSKYNFGECLEGSDFDDVIELLQLHPKAKEKIGAGIKSVRITRLRYDTKCFEVVRSDDTLAPFSYRKLIQAPLGDFQKFSEACRLAVQDDLRNVKLAYFKETSKNGQAKCQETGKLFTWDGLSVDHRQPNTFSVIVDRFIELNEIVLSLVEYDEILGGPNALADSKLAARFREYHRKRANLRVVSKRRNLRRSSMARIANQKKDLRVEKRK